MIYVNLIPTNLWYLNLRSILGNDEWSKLSLKIREQQEWTCQACGIGIGKIKLKKYFHCHEMWDFNDNKNEVKLVCLICLCSYCHEATHYGRASVTNRSKIAFSQICKVNKWNTSTTSLYLEGCFEQWSRRSNKSWIFNLSSFELWLDKKQINIVKDFFKDK